MTKLTDDQIQCYQRDGVVHVQAAIEERCMSWIDEVVEQQLANPSQWANDSNTDQPRDRMFTDRYLWKSDANVRRFVFESGCAALAGQAMGATTARFYFDHLLVKEPQTAAPTPWHQDIPYWPFKGQQVCSVWVALSDATVAGSAMEFVLGSHNESTYYMPKLFAARDDHPADWTLEGSGEPVPDIEADRDRYNIAGWDVQRGDALVFSAWVLHGAPGNGSSDRRRAAISTRWLGDSARWFPHAGADPTVTDADVSVAAGDYPADDETFPLVWSKN